MSFYPTFPRFPRISGYGRPLGPSLRPRRNLLAGGERGSVLAQSRDDLLAQKLDAPHRRLVRLLAFARPEGQVAGIGTVDDVLEFLDDGFGAAGDDQAGASGGLVAAFRHPPAIAHSPS